MIEPKWPASLIIDGHTECPEMQPRRCDPPPGACTDNSNHRSALRANYLESIDSLKEHSCQEQTRNSSTVTLQVRHCHPQEEDSNTQQGECQITIIETLRKALSALLGKPRATNARLNATVPLIVTNTRGLGLSTRNTAQTPALTPSCQGVLLIIP